MKEEFWHDKWQRDDIGFHEISGNTLLTEFFPKLSLSPGDRIFLPLCGKTRDIGWLLEQEAAVAGIELNEKAVDQLFSEMNIIPKVERVGKLSCYSASNIDIFVGNIFDLNKDVLGHVGAIYDRAALVALPEDIRYQYVRHIIDITQLAQQLLISFEYEQSLMPGPPFSVGSRQLYEYYDIEYDVKMLTTREITGGFKNRVPAREEAWLLTPK
ncbi:thiopurine S-methyltransferase [Microbulbifer sp. OS29]|uniref:Thiopurine S-methyltransferase n=1 Tax=Microbulbifer okhotskensis TaxID=2926617 RepID=A0A9X2ELY1_9GAMM|nr:thiopurine S-methyltransferase [Microbulbifer okhotskensis]MCO1334059.1 thiopurine S-methyltransferase [Microbulbifer okhotskensis]